MNINFVPMTRYSRCNLYSGKKIKCPKCGGISTVYHLSWSAITCLHCIEMVEKYDFLIEKGKYSKT